MVGAHLILLELFPPIGIAFTAAMIAHHVFGASTDIAIIAVINILSKTSTFPNNPFLRSIVISAKASVGCAGHLHQRFLLLRTFRTLNTSSIYLTSISTNFVTLRRMSFTIKLLISRYHDTVIRNMFQTPKSTTG